MQTIEEVRRIRLGMLEREFGGQVGLSAKIGKSTSQISQWKNASISATGRERAMSSDVAREIEKLTGKPRGWMDTSPGYAELHPDDRIAHAMLVMESMTPHQLDQAVRVLDTLAQPPSEPPLKNGTEDK